MLHSPALAVKQKTIAMYCSEDFERLFISYFGEAYLKD